MSGLVLRAMGATADSVELLRSNGPSNFNKQTSLFVFLKRKENIDENTENTYTYLLISNDFYCKNVLCNISWLPTHQVLNR